VVRRDPNADPFAGQHVRDHQNLAVSPGQSVAAVDPLFYYKFGPGFSRRLGRKCRCGVRLLAGLSILRGMLPV
jgi:hypothetical protein